MGRMITGYTCSGCGEFHPTKPFEGYVIGMDEATSVGDCTAIVIGKLIPDGEGGVEMVVLDVKTRNPHSIG